MHRLLAGLAVIGALTALSAPSAPRGLLYWRGEAMAAAAVADEHLAPFSGVWEKDGFRLVARQDGRATAAWRTYQWCSPHTLGPCDTLQETGLVPGGRAEMVFATVEARTARGQIFWSVDEELGATWTQLGTGPVSLTLLADGMAELRHHHISLTLCRSQAPDEAVVHLRPAAPCGPPEAAR
jgi:hypothetical protein